MCWVDLPVLPLNKARPVFAQNRPILMGPLCGLVFLRMDTTFSSASSGSVQPRERARRPQSTRPKKPLEWLLLSAFLVCQCITLVLPPWPCRDSGTLYNPVMPLMRRSDNGYYSTIIGSTAPPWPVTERKSIAGQTSAISKSLDNYVLYIRGSSTVSQSEIQMQCLTIRDHQFNFTEWPWLRWYPSLPA